MVRCGVVGGLRDRPLRRRSKRSHAMRLQQRVARSSTYSSQEHRANCAARIHQLTAATAAASVPLWIRIDGETTARKRRRHRTAPRAATSRSAIFDFDSLNARNVSPLADNLVACDSVMRHCRFHIGYRKIRLSEFSDVCRCFLGLVNNYKDVTRKTLSLIHI